MNLSDFSESDRLEAAEFVVKMLNLPSPPDYELTGIATVDRLLTDANAALEAVDKANHSLEIEHEQNQTQWAARMFPPTSWMVCDGVKDLPAAIILCLALAMGWRKK